MKYSSLGVATAIAALIALVAAQPAAADDVPCVGALPPGTYDNVVVPEGAFCHISNSQVRGNVKALSNSTLQVAGGTTSAATWRATRRRPCRSSGRTSLAAMA